jgi:hypothetical protein
MSGDIRAWRQSKQPEAEGSPVSRKEFVFIGVHSWLKFLILKRYIRYLKI